MWKWIVVLSVAFTSTACAETKVLAIAGSARKDSVNKKLVNEAANIARQMGANVTVIDLKDYPMPFYDADLESTEGMPSTAKRLRQLMIENQVVIIASPEYNGSLSGLLKNTIDWASRSEKGQPSREAFQDKKFVIISASPGPGGGARGLAHLRTIIENVGGTVIPSQVIVPGAYEAFDEQGKLKDPKYKTQLEQALNQVVEKNAVPVAK